MAKKVSKKSAKVSPRKTGTSNQMSDPVSARAAVAGKRPAAKPKLLSGGNPQIAKGYGDAPVRAYIEAMSGGGAGWKRDVGRKLDAIIERAAPGVRRAVKYNSPLYGAAGSEGEWFLGIHCFAKYIKVAFFRGASLRPVPPGESEQRDVRYLDVYEDGRIGRGGKGGVFDEVQFADWVRQASRLPGERM